MKKGFTLVELLAVITILAIIAIIATPIVLDIIEESKIESLKISTSEYIRTVNTTLMNEQINNEVKDGLYTIIDDGKKIKLGEEEIEIEYKGNGLKSGLLLIEDSTVTRVLKGMIEDYYARVNGEEITILKKLNESTLVDGQTFNARIKQLVEDKNDDGSDVTYRTIDTKVKEIIFLQDSVLPERYTNESLSALPSIDLSKESDGSIIGYYDEGTGIIYVYSEGYINCPINIRYLFYNFQGVEKIELNLIDTSQVTNMSGMFNNCSSLTKLDLSNFETSKVTTMEYMFENCSSLTELDLSNFDTSKVTTMFLMFDGCSSLTELDLNSFDTSKVTNMGYMFYSCTNIKEIKGLENFDTSQVTNMSATFHNCSSLTSLDLRKWDARKVISIGSWNGGLFRNCSSLKSIKFGPNFTLENVTSFVNNSNGMFQNCSSLEYLDISMFKTSKVTDMSNMFFGCINLKEIKGLEIFETSNVTKMNGMFSNCSSLTELDLSKWDTNKLTSMWATFSGCTNLKSIKFGEQFDTSKVTDMSGTFAKCTNLEMLDLTSFDTHQVIATTHYNAGGSTFSGCTNLKTIKVAKSKWTLDVKSIGLNDGILEYVNE